MLREVGIRNSSPPLSKPHLPQNIDVQPFPLPVLPCPDIPMGGRLAHFVEQWEELTDNKWVFSIVRNGFKIPFKSVPPKSAVPPHYCKKKSQSFSRNGQWKGFGIREVYDFYSRLFLVPKKKGKLRPVIDLSLLNQYMNKHHFKMETVNSVRQSIKVNDWAVSIDVTDAYLHVPIHPIFRKYLRFIFEHQVFSSRPYRLECP